MLLVTILPTAVVKWVVDDSDMSAFTIFWCITIPAFFVEFFLKTLAKQDADGMATSCFERTFEQMTGGVECLCFVCCTCGAIAIFFLSCLIILVAESLGVHVSNLVWPLVLSRIQGYATWFVVDLVPIPCIFQKGFVKSWLEDFEKVQGDASCGDMGESGLSNAD
eukprot:TRINITY_DN18957_c0_g1_i2.p1 TRINITY_DN18957_c0_g1~~TRINITY_DN18957_c0_g1_i2.p1  ORF type:complete len:165 (-),score=17.79 TRINITY_DN18957_c0_g1_i2:253-747(-)